MTRVFVFSTQPYDVLFFEKANASFGFDIQFLDTQLRSKTVQLAKDAPAVSIFVNDHCHDGIIEKLAKNGVKLISLRCAGFNNVDLKAADANGITVVRVPAYSPHAVAEHAIALMMTLNRKIHKAYNRVREQNFSLNGLMGFDLFGKTVGVLGTGNIGQVFAKIMIGFGCRILAYDLYPSESLKDIGVTYVSKEEMFQKSDIISLHCPLNDATRHIINRDAFQMMKNGVMLINTGRGALLDSQAAIEALKIGKLGALALDVYEQEEKLFFRDLSSDIIQDDVIQRLMSFPNVLITAHQAFFTDDAITQIAHTTLMNIKNFLEGKTANRVTLL